MLLHCFSTCTSVALFDLAVDGCGLLCCSLLQALLWVTFLLTFGYLLVSLPPSLHHRRPLRMMSRNGSRGSARIDSASSLNQGTAQQQQHEQQQQQQHVASVQEQMGKVSLNE